MTTRRTRIRVVLLVGAGLGLGSCANPFFDRVENLVNKAANGPVDLVFLSPRTGTFSSNQLVSLSCSTAGATIRFTTNGSKPNASSPVYSAPVSVAGNGTVTTIQAYASMSGMNDSPVSTGTYTINYSMVSTPQAAPPGGSYTVDQLVSLSCSTPGAAIRYTTDGTAPSSSSTIYASPISVAGAGTVMTIRAYATKSGMLDSTDSADTYTIGYVTALPTMTPAGGRIGHSASVSLSCITPGAAIAYTLDGTSPAESGGVITHGTQYAGPFSLPYGSTDVKALAFKTGYADSAVATGSFSETVFLYSANPGTTAVIAESLDLVSGALSTVGSFPNGAFDGSTLAADPAGKFVWVANSATIGAFVINPDSGALTPAAGQPFPTSSPPEYLACDASGKFLYATDSSDEVIGFSINTATGALTSLGIPVGTDYGPSGIAADPVGPFLYVAIGSSGSVEGFQVNPATGALTNTGEFGTGGGLQTVAIAVDPLGRFLYAASLVPSSVSAFAINSSTGALTNIGSPLTVGSQAFSLVVDPSGRFLYVADRASACVYWFTIDQGSGALTDPCSVPTGPVPVSVCVDPSGNFLYVATSGSNAVSAFRINSSTGALAGAGTFGQASAPTFALATGPQQ